MELEAFGRGGQQFFEDGGGFSVVVGFVFAYGLLEEAVEIAIRGVGGGLGAT